MQKQQNLVKTEPWKSWTAENVMEWLRSVHLDAAVPFFQYRFGGDCMLNVESLEESDLQDAFLIMHPVLRKQVMHKIDILVGRTDVGHYDSDSVQDVCKFFSTGLHAVNERHFKEIFEMYRLDGSYLRILDKNFLETLLGIPARPAESMMKKLSELPKLHLRSRY
jgi:hypothetical protein